MDPEDHESSWGDIKGIKENEYMKDGLVKVW